MMGIVESSFNVSLTVRAKVTKTVSVNHNWRLKRKESRSVIERRPFRLPPK